MYKIEFKNIYEAKQRLGKGGMGTIFLTLNEPECILIVDEETKKKNMQYGRQTSLLPSSIGNILESLMMPERFQYS